MRAGESLGKCSSILFRPWPSCWRKDSPDWSRSLPLYSMAVKRARALCLCVGLTFLLPVSSQTVLPAAAGTQAAATPAGSYAVPGVTNPTICAEGDVACNAALVQPANDTNYVNCINTPTAPLCTSSSSGASTESSASPEDACPTDPILDQGFTQAQLEIQVVSFTDDVAPART